MYIVIKNISGKEPFIPETSWLPIAKVCEGQHCLGGGDTASQLILDAVGAETCVEKNKIDEF